MFNLKSCLCLLAVISYSAVLFPETITDSSEEILECPVYHLKCSEELYPDVGTVIARQEEDLEKKLALSLNAFNAADPRGTDISIKALRPFLKSFCGITYPGSSTLVPVTSETPVSSFLAKTGSYLFYKKQVFTPSLVAEKEEDKLALVLAKANYYIEQRVRADREFDACWFLGRYGFWDSGDSYDYEWTQSGLDSIDSQVLHSGPWSDYFGLATSLLSPMDQRLSGLEVFAEKGYLRPLVTLVDDHYKRCLSGDSSACNKAGHYLNRLAKHRVLPIRAQSVEYCRKSLQLTSELLSAPLFDEREDNAFPNSANVFSSPVTRLNSELEPENCMQVMVSDAVDSVGVFKVEGTLEYKKKPVGSNHCAVLLIKCGDKPVQRKYSLPEPEMDSMVAGMMGIFFREDIHQVISNPYVIGVLLFQYFYFNVFPG